MNKGKEFEQDFKKSLESSGLDLWIYRPSDFGGGQASRFTNPSLCDYIVFDKSKGDLYLFELKSSQSTSFSIMSVEDYYSLVDARNKIDEVVIKEDKKVAQKACKELLKKFNGRNIKYHQLRELLNIQMFTNTQSNMYTYFIINFRKYNRTFIITPKQLWRTVCKTGKASVNLQDMEDYGIEITQEKIRNTQHFNYDVSPIFNKT